MLDATARTCATAAVWLAVAIVLTAGVFRANWNGNAALVAELLTVLIVCGAATVSTGLVWCGRGRGPAVARGFEPIPVTAAD